MFDLLALKMLLLLSFIFYGKFILFPTNLHFYDQIKKGLDK